MTLKKNDLITLQVTDINMMGHGVAKHGDAVVFVQNAVPGDEALCRIIKCAKNYYVARIERLSNPSSERKEPECLHFRRCGGCNFQHVSYDLEKRVKKNYVRSCLKKEGLDDVIVKDVISAEQISRYRNKAQFPLALDESGRIIFGFYSPKTHKVCAIEDCLIQDERFLPIAKDVVSFIQSRNISVYNEKTGRGLVRHIYLRSAKNSGQLMLCLVLTEDAFSDEAEFCSYIRSKHQNVASIVFNINSENTNVILGKKYRTVYGAPHIRDVLCNRDFDISPASFYQVNHDGAELLYRTAFSMIQGDYDLLIDLYCGIGTISISSYSTAPILGIEIVKDAVEDANHNAILNRLNNAEFICGDAGDAFQLIHNHGSKKPLVVVDPPRKGLSEALIDDLARNNISQILYISCGADTMARDLKRFRNHSYRIGAVQPVDMFCRTGHIESIVLISK